MTSPAPARAALFGAFFLSCSGAPAPSAAPNDGPAATTDSAHDALRVSLYCQPGATPVRGNNQVDLDFAAAKPDAEDALTQLDVQLSTFMPAMGHGSGHEPKLVSIQGTRYRFDNVVLTMPGLWELQVRVSGDVEDQAVFRFDVQ